MVTPPHQFSICENRGASADVIPYLLYLQHRFADTLGTRIVVPVERRQGDLVGIPQTLVEVDIGGEAFVAIVPELSAVNQDDIGQMVASAENQRYAIMNAIDFLLGGY